MLFLVRHGRTAANASGLLLGRLDVPLDETGLEQAALLGKALTGAERIITSPLTRCRQTADAIGGPVEIDDRWIELDYGEFDGQPLSTLGRVVWERWREDPGYVPPGGESLVTMADRVVGALAAVAPEGQERDIVIVSHVSPIKAAAAWSIAAGFDMAWRSHLDQASITRVAITPAGPVLRSFNDTSHLGSPPGPLSSTTLLHYGKRP